MLNFGHKQADMPGYELFSAIVFAGAGGTANLFYSFYYTGVRPRPLALP